MFKMGGCRCSYKNCKSATKNCDSIHFFHYPVKNPPRCKQWIEHANKPEFFDLPEDVLKNKVVCELHFEDRCFSNATRKRLVHDAVPTLDVGCEEQFTSANGDYNDVQVLPANADGTIFTVDTEAMQQLCDSNDIETYVYKNGVLTRMSKSEAKLFYGSSNYDVIYAVTDEVLDNYNNDSNSNSPITSESAFSIESNQKLPSFSESVSYTIKTEPHKTNYNSYRHFKHEKANISPSSDVNSQEVISTEVEIYTPDRDIINYQTIPESTVEEEETINNLANKQQKKGNNCLKRKLQIQRKLIQRLNHHSREINSIKQLLKSYSHLNLTKKQKQRFALNTIKQYIPNTLYKVILHTLRKKDKEVTQQKMDFFKHLYTISPKAYQLLQDQQWGLPEYKDNIQTISESIQTSEVVEQSVQTEYYLEQGVFDTNNHNNEIEIRTKSLQKTIGIQCHQSDTVEQISKSSQCFLDQFIIRQNQASVGTQYIENLQFCHSEKSKNDNEIKQCDLEIDHSQEKTKTLITDDSVEENMHIDSEKT